MGRIVPQFVKRVGAELVQMNPKKFTKVFDENKKAVAEMTEISTKKLRNKIAGHITRKLKNAKEINLN